MAGGFGGRATRRQGARCQASPVRPTRFEPGPTEVVEAVSSLYEDELKPFGRILLKRLRERAAISAAAAQGIESSPEVVAAGDLDDVAHIDPKYLRRVCEGCPTLTVEPADGREYAVLMEGRPSTFVDVCSPVDIYPPTLWAEASAYFESLREEECSLPGGRYACAQVLMARGLPFLMGRSLGEACHIVQLAVSQKKILGYLQGRMVPYGHSEEHVKERCAAWQQPVGGPERVAASPLRLATWADARACLREILESGCNPSPGTITMSNVKRLFRSRFDLELSETALGHSRLCELLQDVRLRDVCSVQSMGNGQVVVRNADCAETRQSLPMANCNGERTPRENRRGSRLGPPPGYHGPMPPLPPNSTCASMRSVMMMQAQAEGAEYYDCQYMPQVASVEWEGGAAQVWGGYPYTTGMLDWNTPKELEWNTPKELDWNTPKELDWNTPNELDWSTQKEDQPWHSGCHCDAMGIATPTDSFNMASASPGICMDSPGFPEGIFSFMSSPTSSPVTSISDCYSVSTVNTPPQSLCCRGSGSHGSDIETCSITSGPQSEDSPSGFVDETPKHTMVGACDASVLSADDGDMARGVLAFCAFQDDDAGEPDRDQIPQTPPNFPAIAYPKRRRSISEQLAMARVPVRNTFIHIPTDDCPQEGRATRSLSVPRNLAR